MHQMALAPGILGSAAGDARDVRPPTTPAGAFCTMTTPTADSQSRPLPHHVAVIGAAGGLGQGILNVCRSAGKSFTAIVRSRPERITTVPVGSRVVVVESLNNRPALMGAFAGADAVLTALGVTATTHKHSVLLSANMAAVEESMLAAGVERIVMVNTLVTSLPGQPTNRMMRFFMWMPGTMGRGAREQQAVINALGNGAFSSLRWTLVRGVLALTEKRVILDRHLGGRPCASGHEARRVFCACSASRSR